MGQIYMATCTITNLSYIGKAVNWKDRKKHHIRPSAPDCYFHRAINKYGKDNFLWQVLEDNIPQDKLNEREIYWISFYNTYLGPGYNETYGGDGGFESCHKWQKEHPIEFKNIQNKAREQAKIWRIKNQERARENSLKALEKAHVGWLQWYKNNPDKIKDNQKKASLAGAKVKAKKVYCFELDKIFQSISEASRELKIDSTNISRACKGKRKTAGKYHWKYVIKN